MKKLLLFVLSVSFFASCQKQTASPEQPDEAGGQVNISFVEEDYLKSKSFFENTATAEAWENLLTSMQIYVFDTDGKLVAVRTMSSAEITAKKASFSLPHSVSGSALDFYAIANYPAVTVATRSELEAVIENLPGEYNAAMDVVATKSARSEGFVMAGSVREAVGGLNTTTPVGIILKRTVAKIAVQTSMSPEFAARYNGALRVDNITLRQGAERSYLLARPTPFTASRTFEYPQFSRPASGIFQNLFYVYETPALATASRVTLVITATYDNDGDFSTTGDQYEVVYELPLEGSGGGQIVRNGYYRVDARISGLAGADIEGSIVVAPWEVPVTQTVDLGI